MVAVMLQVIHSFYATDWKISILVSANLCEKYILSKNYCIVHHEDKMCFWPKCSYLFILLEDIEELLQKSDAFYFTYQHVVCLYTLFKYRFNDQTVVKSGQELDIVQRAVYFN